MSLSIPVVRARNFPPILVNVKTTRISAFAQEELSYCVIFTTNCSKQKGISVLHQIQAVMNHFADGVILAALHFGLDPLFQV